MLVTYFASCEVRFCKLRYVEKKSYAQIAGLMGLPIEIVVLLEQSMMQDLRAVRTNPQSPANLVSFANDPFIALPILGRIAIFMLVQAAKDMAESTLPENTRGRRKGRINWKRQNNTKTALDWLQQREGDFVFSISFLQNLLDSNTENTLQLAPIADLILEDPSGSWESLRDKTQYGIEDEVDYSRRLDTEYDFEASKSLSPPVSTLFSILHRAKFPEMYPHFPFEEVWRDFCDVMQKVALARGDPDMFKSAKIQWPNGTIYDSLAKGNGKIPDMAPVEFRRKGAKKKEEKGFRKEK